MKKLTKKVKEKRLSRHLERVDLKAAETEVMRVAYEILDEIVCPVVGIKGAWADLTQAEIPLYLDSSKREATRQRKEIITKIAKRYGASEYSLAQVWRQPLALVALVAMGRGVYRRYADGDKKGKAVPPDQAWSYLAYADERLRPAQVVKAKVVSTPRHGIHLRAGRWSILVHITDVAWGKDVGPDEYAKVGEQLEVTILRTLPGENAAVGWLPWPKETPKKTVSLKVARRKAVKEMKARRAATVAP